MSAITEKARAKLNLSLDVQGLRPDGYHEMRMVMQSVELCDDVILRPTRTGRTQLRCNLRYLPTDGRNIAVKAAESFFSAAGISSSGLDIELKKRIPVCAGLGGGSSDAAAVLRGLNRLYRRPFSLAELEELSRGLGSDVAFCVRGGTRLASGRGDELSPLPDFPPCCIVICKPAFSISTPELFRVIDSRKSRVHPDTEGLAAAIAQGDVRAAGMRMYNVFEDVLPRRCEEIFTIKARLLDLGAAGTMMSGTGSAVFGLFDDTGAAAAAKMQLSGNYKDCFLTVPTKEYNENVY